MVACLLTALQEANIPFCVVSNSDSKGLERKLKKTGLYDFVHTRIFSRDVDQAKCIVVEDSGSGIRAGVAAGAAEAVLDKQKIFYLMGLPLPS